MNNNNLKIIIVNNIFKLFLKFTKSLNEFKALILFNLEFICLMKKNGKIIILFTRKAIDSF